MFERLDCRGWLAKLAWAGVLGAAVSAAGCGGAGAGAGGGASSAGGSISQVIVETDKNTLPGSDGSVIATVSVLVKDSANNVVRNQSVTATTTDTGVTLAPAAVPNLTDASGRATFTLQAGGGANGKANRTINIVAIAGNATGQLALEWVNTRLLVSGQSSLVEGASNVGYEVKAVDGAGAALPGVDVAATFDAGTVKESSKKTDSAGKAVFEISATRAIPGTLEVRADGLNAKSSFSVAVQALNQPLVFDAPGPNVTGAGVAEVVPIRVRYQPGAGTSVAGLPVRIATTRGVLANGETIQTLTTNSSGEVATTVTSSAVGPATLNATLVLAPPAVSLTASRTLSFRSSKPATLTISTERASIPTNLQGTRASTTAVSAYVRDVNDNPVSGIPVAFSAVDPSGGLLEGALGTTDDSGEAKAVFVAGPTSTGPQAVTITATGVVDGPPAVLLKKSAKMTVTSAPLFIELGTGNSIRVKDDTTYEMPWSAIVTDANRNPVVGAQVTTTLTAINYFKGIWYYSGAWQPRSFADVTKPAVQCLSEDLADPVTGRPNNLLDPGEDRNGNVRLDPGSPAAALVTSADGKTGSDGRSTISVGYPKSCGSWVEVTLSVTISTPGSESTLGRTFVLPVLAGDVTSREAAPPNVNAQLSSDEILPQGTPPRSLIGPYGFGDTRISAPGGIGYVCTEAR